MVSKDENLSLSQQCDLLNINRSRIYYTPRTKSKEDLIIMRLIDERNIKARYSLQILHIILFPVDLYTLQQV